MSIISFVRHLHWVRLKGRLVLGVPLVSPKFIRSIMPDEVLDRPPRVLVTTVTELNRAFMASPFRYSSRPYVMFI